MLLSNGKLFLATVVYLLVVSSGMAQRREVDYSRIKATPSARPVMASPVESGRATKPSILTVKAFAVDISKPMTSAIASITSKATGKTQQFSLVDGRLERVFEGPDVLAIEVSGEGYTTAFRSMTIAVSPTGNRYEFDAQLDPAPIKLTVWAVDSRTNKLIHDARFTISGKAGKTTLLLTPDSVTGLVKTDLPGRGVYQLTSSANGYGDFTKSIRLDSVQSEARVMLTPKKTPDITKTQALPEAVVKSAKTAYVETPTAKPALKAPALSANLRMPAVTNQPFGAIEKGKAVTLKNIYFDQSSPVLRPESSPELDQLAAVLSENPALQIEIRGHTDNQGDFDLNVKLSRDRCQAVIDYLAGKGIAKSRLKAVGRGPIDPVSPNSSEDNRKKNRRVEFVAL
ncbi:OmpA family protein [Spirosoma fluviale]|uniref:OmpA family protein n=1 Tax=Spirosoma fluviale TaxID=1597977 RepID=A0A286F550_9BACT|nr:OmpA family protein [Spirosoma fluviale]SOD78302.1 OmpA family protein [Spirosoma fluviale]